MHKNAIATLVALTLVATAAAPQAIAGLSSVDATEYTQAPAGVLLKDLGNTAFAFCQLVDGGVPFACDPNPGTIPALGGAFFNVTAWNNEAGAAASYGRVVEIQVTQTDGQAVGGFAAFACTDWNDDTECDNGSTGFAGNGDEPCGGDDKDTKDCGDSTNLGLTFCAEKDDYPYTLIHDNGTITDEYDDEYDDFVVFIEWWADLRDDEFGNTSLLENEHDNTGAGLSFGTFRVDADYQGFVAEDACRASNTINEAEGDGASANWQGAATVVVDGTDSNSSVDQGVMECGASSGNGQGGFCLHDDSVQAVYVFDTAQGTDQIAFQVCRDKNPITDGNGTRLGGTCTDAETKFSHGNDGTIVNPILVPEGEGQIVVFICAGVHTPSGETPGSHQHAAVEGTGTAVEDLTKAGAGFDAENGFCGGSPTAFVDGEEQGGKVYAIRAP